jgi:hypothetical protein
LPINHDPALLPAPRTWRPVATASLLPQARLEIGFGAGRSYVGVLFEKAVIPFSREKD